MVFFDIFIDYVSFDVMYCEVCMFVLDIKVKVFEVLGVVIVKCV